MQIKIPSDWNGQDWFCLQVEWPDSPEFVGLLFGLLTQLTRGRIWDARTGSVKDAQDIAWEIHDRNFPINPCGNGETPLPDKEYIYRFISSVDSEGLMSACGYNPKAFRWNDQGELEIRDFCGDWVSIGAPGYPPIEPPPEVWDDLDPQPEYYACGKVDAWINTLWTLGNAMWEYYNDESEYESQLKAAVPNAGLSRWEIYVSIAQMYALAELYSRSTIMDTELFQEFRCVAVIGIDDTSTCTEAEIDYMSDSIGRVIESRWGLGNSELIKGFFYRMGNMVGKNDAKNIATLGAINGNADCSCPGADLEPTDPTVSGWYLGQAMASTDIPVPTDPEWAYPVLYTALEHDVFGVVFQLDYKSGGSKDRFKPSNNEGTLTLTYDVMLNGTNSASLNLNTNYAGMGPNAYSELFPTSGAVRTQDGITVSDNANSPVALKGQIAMFVAACRALTESGVWTMTKWRWVHNINSPSHQ